MKPKHLLWLLVGLLIWVVCHNAWLIYGAKTYYFGTAAIIAISACILHDIQHTFLTRVFLFLSINNLADELFFDPAAFSVNEYITFLLFFVYSIYRNRKPLKAWISGIRL
jgi:glutamate synthase domain-containing protein 2